MIFDLSSLPPSLSPGYPPVGRADVEKLNCPLRGMRGEGQGRRDAPIDDEHDPN